MKIIEKMVCLKNECNDILTTGRVYDIKIHDTHLNDFKNTIKADDGFIYFLTADCLQISTINGRKLAKFITLEEWRELQLENILCN
jgi:hypothetical protein